MWSRKRAGCRVRDLYEEICTLLSSQTRTCMLLGHLHAQEQWMSAWGVAIVETHIVTDVPCAGTQALLCLDHDPSSSAGLGRECERTTMQ